MLLTKSLGSPLVYCSKKYSLSASLLVLESIAWSNAFEKDLNSSGSPWNQGMSLCGKHDSSWFYTSSSVILVWRFITLNNSVSLFCCLVDAGVKLGLCSVRTFSLVSGGLGGSTGLYLSVSLDGEESCLCWPSLLSCWVDCVASVAPSSCWGDS